MGIYSVSAKGLRAGFAGPFSRCCLFPWLLHCRSFICETSITLRAKIKNQKSLVEPGTRFFVSVIRSHTHTQYPSKRSNVHIFNSDLHACTPALRTSNVQVGTLVPVPTHNALQNVPHSLLYPSLQNGVVVAFPSVKNGIDGAVQVTRAIVSTHSYIVFVFSSLFSWRCDMHKPASERSLVVYDADIVLLMERYNVPENIAGVLMGQRLAVHQIKSQFPVYLPLPTVIGSIARQPLYSEALHHGRVWYRSVLVGRDLLGQEVRTPRSFSRPEVFEMVNEDIRPSDDLLALVLPLAWRVGFCVGWLSGLSISQRDDAQAGLVMLAALVAPLLGNVPAGGVPNISGRSQSGRK